MAENYLLDANTTCVNATCTSTTCANITCAYTNSTHPILCQRSVVGQVIGKISYDLPARTFEHGGARDVVLGLLDLLSNALRQPECVLIIDEKGII